MIATGAQTHAAVWIAGVLLLGFLGLRGFEQLNVFVPTKTMYAHPGTIGVAYEDVWLFADDGAKVHAWWVPLAAGSPVILYSHGNGGNISTRVEVLRRLREAGASVLLYDYRGYGLSPGTPTEAGTYRDGEAAYRWLTGEKKIDPKRVVMLGESLGCGVAVELARRHPAGGLIFESGFTSIVAMGKRVFPFLPVETMTRYRYDNLAKIAGLRCPVLVMHSPQDEIIPYEMGREIFAAAPQPKTFFAMTGDHNEGFLETGPAYVAAIKGFLESLPR